MKKTQHGFSSTNFRHPMVSKQAPLINTTKFAPTDAAGMKKRFALSGGTPSPGSNSAKGKLIQRTGGMIFKYSVLYM